jgi:methionyl-tRNA formyltransferase
MRIALACGGRRGLAFLNRLRELAPQPALTVFSFREEPHEPPFLDDIRASCEAHGGIFHETRKVDGARGLSLLAAAVPELMFVIGWRYLIRRDAYEIPRRGTYVIHDSVLPGYRGFSPTVWAIRNGEICTGATLFRIAADVDSGDIVDQRCVPIGAEDTIADVAPRVTQAYLDLLEANLPGLADGSAVLKPQDHERASYVARRTVDHDRIDWQEPSRRVLDLVRAVTMPYRGAFCYVDGRKLIVWSARPWHGDKATDVRAGTVLRTLAGLGAVVCTGDGAVLLCHVQCQGDPLGRTADFLTPGLCLESMPREVMPGCAA